MRDFYAATVPVFTKLLGGVDRWLDKSIALADKKRFDVQVLLDARIAPDQYHFTRQVQSACDYAKFAVAKLAGKTAPEHPDSEKTLVELRTRVRTVIDYVATFEEADFAGSEGRLCSHAWMDGKALRGADYLDHVALPNFHFHLAMAFAILRHNGVALGKMDYLGPLPFAESLTGGAAHKR